jgi:hypothetical protein
LVCLALTAPVALGATDEAVAKKGKIHACYATKGPSKGAMRFVRTKKCRPGEKSLSWNKKGMAGPAGQTGAAGQAGPPGPAGSGGSSDTIEQLRTQLDQQSVRISDLEGQVAQLTSQSVALAAQLGAACGQLANLTDQSNDLGTAIDGIDLTGVLGGLTFTNPGAPTALASFAC